MTSSIESTRARIKEQIEILAVDHEGLKVDADGLSRRPADQVLLELRAAAEPRMAEARRAGEEARQRLAGHRTRGRVGLAIFGVAILISLSGMFVPAMDPFGLPAIGVAVAGYLLFRVSYVGQLRARGTMRDADAEAELWKTTLEDWEQRSAEVSGESEEASLRKLESILGAAVTRGRRKSR
ncbi:MAG: hypothetical protein RL885_28780 [Planctomycetota bacterium]